MTATRLRTAAHVTDVNQLKDELVDAHAWGEVARARDLLARLGEQSGDARSLLVAMLEDPDAQVRQAAAFGLGELGGPASTRCLEQQLAVEEARADYDAAAVVEDIVAALGNIDDAGARIALAARLERMAAGTPEPGEASALARALWRRRHPDLLPVVRRSLARLPPSATDSLHGLRVLLEKTPAELPAWVHDATVCLAHKAGVLTVLDADVPDALLSTVPAFIALAQALAETAVAEQGEASYYCERLFSFLVLHREQILAVLPDTARAELRTLSQRLLASVAPNCSLRAASLLEFVGQPEDAALVETHRPQDFIGAKAFDDIAQALRRRPK